MVDSGSELAPCAAAVVAIEAQRIVTSRRGEVKGTQDWVPRRLRALCRDDGSWVVNTWQMANDGRAYAQ